MGEEMILPPLGDVPASFRDFTLTLRALYREAGSPSLIFLNSTLLAHGDPNMTFAGDLAGPALRGELLPPWSKVEALVSQLVEWGRGRDLEETLENVHVKWLAADVGQFIHRVQDDVSRTGGKSLAESRSGPVLARGLLKVASGPEVGRIWELNEPVVRLGRDAGCDIQLSDTAVSRWHAAISRTGVNFTVEDLGSTNGTFLNGKGLERSVQYLIEDQDWIRIGSYNFTFLAHMTMRF
jgi:hypothetical protein